MLTIAVAFKNPWRIATDVPLTSKELESAIASASILFWRKNNGACRQHALLLAAQALRRATSVAEELNDRHLRGARFEAEMRFSI